MSQDFIYNVYDLQKLLKLNKLLLTRTGIQTETQTNTHTHTHIYILYITYIILIFNAYLKTLNIICLHNFFTITLTF